MFRAEPGPPRRVSLVRFAALRHENRGSDRQGCAGQRAVRPRAPTAQIRSPPGEAGQASSWLKLDQEIHIALGPLAAFEHRAEQGQPPDVIVPTDLGELVAIEGQVSRHAVLSQKRGCAGPLMAANRAARPGEQSHGRTMPSYSDF